MAAIYGNVVQIYSSTTFENVSNLKGHNGKVKSVVWTSDDTRIVTCGVDGAVYEWDVLTGLRLAENVLKLCSYTGVALSPDAKTTFAVGSDHTLKEISDSQVSLYFHCCLVSLVVVFRPVRRRRRHAAAADRQGRGSAAARRTLTVGGRQGTAPCRRSSNA